MLNKILEVFYYINVPFWYSVNAWVPFFPGVHDYRTSPGYHLSYGLFGEPQKPAAIFP